MTKNIKNYNLSKLNGLTDINNTLSNISINNSIKISHSSETTNTNSDNANAGLYIKDINSDGLGDFYKLLVNSKNSEKASLYFNNNELIDNTNILSNLEDILEDYTLETSNLIVTNGYINFSDGTLPNPIQGNNGVGIRYSSDKVQFKNKGKEWIDLEDITTHDEFKELKDVSITTNLSNNQYITYNSTSQKFVNSNLSIINDINPKLGGDLDISDYLIKFGNAENRLVYNLGTIKNNNLLVLKNNSDEDNHYSYLEINNSNLNTNPSIKAKSTAESDPISIDLTTLNNGSINLNATTGSIYTNSKSLIIDGFIKNSIVKSSSFTNYIPLTTFEIPLLQDTVLFDFIDTSPEGTYYANIGSGTDGQKLNLIYNNISSNSISVKADFGTNKIILGTGYGNGLIFDTLGQSSTLIYLGEPILCWQVLNTGCGIF